MSDDTRNYDVITLQTAATKGFGENSEWARNRNDQSDVTFVRWVLLLMTSGREVNPLIQKLNWVTHLDAVADLHLKCALRSVWQNTQNVLTQN